MYIKHLFLVSFLSLLLTGFSYTKSIWLEDFQKAKEKAKVEEKPILMVFAGSDWCKPCILLEREVFQHEAFNNFAEKELVLLKLDFPRKRKNAIPKEIKAQHEKLAEKYNPEGAFPLVLLLNYQGEVLQTIQHQSNQPQQFTEQIQKILNQ